MKVWVLFLGWDVGDFEIYATREMADAAAVDRNAGVGNVSEYDVIDDEAADMIGEAIGG